VGGGFLTIANSGQTADRLIAATSEVANAVELHQMKMEGDMMKMSPVESGIDIPPGGTVELAPGGLHIMFIGIGQPFEEGACVEVTLTFEQAGELPVVLSVGGVSAASAAGGHQSH
jgi:periplasmic copper chaperone A